MKRVGRIFRESMVAHVKEGIQNRNSTFMLSYTKVSGPQMNSLRKGLKTIGAELCVSRNSIAEIALKDLNFEKLTQRISGQTAFVISDADSIEVSKTLIKFMKECEGLQIQGGLLEGVILEKADIQRLADLPSRPILLTMLLRTLNTPMTRLARALNGKTRDLLSVLKQLAEKNAANREAK